MRKPNFTLGVNPETISNKVLLTTDPDTMLFAGEDYMKQCVHFNVNRNFPGLTGNYRGKRVTVISAGIGMASMGLLAEELYEKYDVESIVYIGSCVGLKEAVAPQDYILAQTASTDSNYPDLLGLPGTVTPTADFELTTKLHNRFTERIALGLPRHNFYKPDFIDDAKVHVGTVLSSDRRITDALEAEEWAGSGALAADMAAAALFVQAQKAGKKAAAFLTVDRNVITGEEMPDRDYRWTPNDYTCMRPIAISLEVL